MDTHKKPIDAFADPSDISQAVDITNDNAVLYTAANGEDILGYRYIGAPTHRQDPNVSVPGYYLFNTNAKSIGSDAVMISKWNRRLIQKCDHRYSGIFPGSYNDDANYVDVMLSYAEVCFMMSEFILKGHTAGDAEMWYNRGVESSLKYLQYDRRKG